MNTLIMNGHQGNGDPRQHTKVSLAAKTPPSWGIAILSWGFLITEWTAYERGVFGTTDEGFPGEEVGFRNRTFLQSRERLVIVKLPTNLRTSGKHAIWRACIKRHRTVKNPVSSQALQPTSRGQLLVFCHQSSQSGSTIRAPGGHFFLRDSKDDIVWWQYVSSDKHNKTPRKAIIKLHQFLSILQVLHWYWYRWHKIISAMNEDIRIREDDCNLGIVEN